MKLAQALQERADLNRKIQQLSSRISANALVQEGEKPAEDPKELLAQLEESTARLETLITAINLCNSRTVVDGESLQARGIIKHADALVKVLGDGELTKALTVRVDKVSASAASKIEAAGGKVELPC